MTPPMNLARECTRIAGPYQQRRGEMLVGAVTSDPPGVN